MCLTRSFPVQGGRVVLLIVLTVLSGSLSDCQALADCLYTVRQTYTVKDLPGGAKHVRGWFWMPEDRPEQHVVEFRVVDGPASLRITRDPTYGRCWLYAEADAETAKALQVVTEFKVIRRAVTGMAVAAKAGPLTAEHRRAFAAELRRDEKHMEVTPQIEEIANTVAGNETNPVLQARKFFDYVIEKSDHYSKFGMAPKGKCLGDAMECLSGTGDCCTDQHALFIALCRARGNSVSPSLREPSQAGERRQGSRSWLPMLAVVFCSRFGLGAFGCFLRRHGR